MPRLNRTIERVTASLDQFLFNDAANALYDFIWHDFCDWYLEIAKIQLQDTATRVWTNIQLRYLLETSLRLLHPIMPFVTEELWQHLEDSRSSLMIAKWPTVQKAAIDANTEADFELVQSIVTAIRNTKAELNVPVESRPSVLLTSKRHVTDKLLRLEQKVEETQYQLTQIEVRFKDTQFTQKAPAEVIEQTRLRQAQLQDTLKKFSSHLTVLRSM
ncbi:MAG: class I tRNA ligase family protein [Candidatus Omnitrophica bacterium]|nr:class I tRNA ligase family protein [Candidatus Omnitrophota bacterium]